jgi:hypothetical protein
VDAHPLDAAFTPSDNHHTVLSFHKKSFCQTISSNPFDGSGYLGSLARYSYRQAISVTIVGREITRSVCEPEASFESDCNRNDEEKRIQIGTRKEVEGWSGSLGYLLSITGKEARGANPKAITFDITQDQPCSRFSYWKPLIEQL